MKEGIGIRTLVDEVTAIAKAKRDYTVPAHAMSFEARVIIGEHPDDPPRTPYTELVFDTPADEPDSFVLTDLANRQLASHLDVPGKFYGKLLNDFPDLLTETVNTLLAARPASEKRLVRTLRGETRAFLSDTYNPLDNFDLLRYTLPLFYPQDKETGMTLVGDTAIKALRAPGSDDILTVDFGSVNVTDNNLYLKILAPQIQRELKVGTIVRSGVMIKNSEVGLAKIGVYPFYEVLSCLNGAFLTDFGNTRRHVGRASITDVTSVFDGNDSYRLMSRETKELEDKAIFMKMGDTVRASMTEVMFARMTEPMVKAMGNGVHGDIVGAVEVTSKLFGINEAEQEDVLRWFVDQHDLTQWGLSNAVTRAAQADGLSYDRATELEGIGGDIITLDPSEWHTIAEAKRKPKATRNGAASPSLMSQAYATIGA